MSLWSLAIFIAFVFWIELNWIISLHRLKIAGATKHIKYVIGFNTNENLFLNWIKFKSMNWRKVQDKHDSKIDTTRIEGLCPRIQTFINRNCATPALFLLLSFFLSFTLLYLIESLIRAIRNPPAYLPVPPRHPPSHRQSIQLSIIIAMQFNSASSQQQQQRRTNCWQTKI